ncbi:uncharacterized protein LOC130927005 [Corythoichthys intestinalis]|uniref:uncharacterized protein LOC130927005 n=1 Tax=Corythoichthys intestinalis TaxID=161448 RepID=UPI0025A66548|nr:uncharacterized protein LOC130927005 [Corythoichthys intestinalis]
MKSPSLLIQVAIVLGLWALQGVLSKEESCPSGWLEFKDSCYYYCPKDQGKKSWNEARNRCDAKGGHLVIIRSIEERNWLQSKYSGKSWWIGLTYRAVENEWKWIDETPLSECLSHWHPGVPDKWGGEENCAEIFWRSGYWNDYRCHMRTGYICKRCRDSDGKIYNNIKGTCNLQVDVYQDVSEVLFEERLRKDRVIVIQGKVKLNPTKFVIHLSLGHGEDTPLRIEVDFTDGDLELVTRIGSHVGGKYVNKVIEKDCFPFIAGSDFEMTIKCGVDIFHLTVGKDYEVKYMNDGYNLEDIYRLLVEGDVTVTAVRLI